MAKKAGWSDVAASYAGREVAGLAGFTIDDKHRARKIWSRYHGKDPTIKQEISFAIHQTFLYFGYFFSFFFS